MRNHCTLSRSDVWSLTKTRPDIAFAVGNVARFCSEPTEVHWSAVKRIMRYLKGTQDLGLLYHKHSTALSCIGYADADWGGSLDDRKSTSGYVFQWSGAAVSWKSQKQTCVALSTAEVNTLPCLLQPRIRQLIGDIAAGGIRPMEILEDNQSAICLAVFHDRTKHVELKYHFIRDQVGQGNITLTYCPSETMIADILTKHLSFRGFDILLE